MAWPADYFINPATAIGASEAETLWTEFLRGLTRQCS
jgi:hypothetical protein